MFGLMEKSIRSEQYRRLIQLFRRMRENKGITQSDLAQLIGENQNFVSKVETLERRLDVIELRTMCEAIGVSFPHFIKEFEKSIANA